jgi:septal ring factor EnvC (AmiA/AmiB activator)
MGAPNICKILICLSFLLLSSNSALAGPGAEVPADPGRVDPELPEDPAAALDQLDLQLIEVAAAQRVAQAQAQAAQAELAGIEAAVDQLQWAVLQAREGLGVKMQRHRRYDERAFTRALLDAEDRGTGLRVRQTLRALLAADLQALRRLRADEARLDEARVARHESAATVQAHTSAVNAQRARLEAARAERAAWVRMLAREVHLRRRLSEAQARGAEALAAELERAVPAEDPSVAFAAEQGRLPAPVPGRLIEGFGERRDPESGTRTRSQGWRIEAPRGAPVRSVFEGTVGFAGWYQGFGNLVIVDHGAGWLSLYGHLDTLAVHRGDGVGAGAPVGEVGDTGALGGPQLYFEIRAQRSPVDPAAWLRPGPIATGTSGSHPLEFRP